MSNPELPLAGGNASSFVVLVGDTVRKPWTPAAPSIHRLLEHLRTKVGTLVPEPRGRDDRGRQVLEYVPGVEVMSTLPIDQSYAGRVGASIRSLHEAVASFERRDTDVWATAMRRPGDEIIGHNDLAPWNLIRGRDRSTFIDWDGAGPTTRIADLAYAARAFARIDHDHEPDETIPLLRAILDGYDASEEERRLIVPAMVERTEAMHLLLAESIATGAQPWASMAVDGHADFWASALEHLRRHAGALEAAIR